MARGRLAGPAPGRARGRDASPAELRVRARIRPRPRPPHPSRSRAAGGRDITSCVWSAHHLQVDGWSWPLVLRDLSALYESRIGGRAPERESPGRYARYLAWLREGAPDSTAFWREALAGFRAPTPVLPRRAVGDAPAAAPRAKRRAAARAPHRGARIARTPEARSR